MAKKSKSIPNPYARKIPLPCRVNAEEMRQIVAKAFSYNGGNVSQYVRDAALAWNSNHVRKKK